MPDDQRDDPARPPAGDPPRMSPTVKVKVREGWIVWDGKTQRTGGEVVTVESAQAAEWLAAGLVDPVKKSTK